LSCLTGQVVGPRTEARVAVAVAVTQVGAAPAVVATRGVVVLESVQVPARVAALEPAQVVGVAADTTNPQLLFVA
jgi:hypothetical protein